MIIPSSQTHLADLSEEPTMLDISKLILQDFLQYRMFTFKCTDSSGLPRNLILLTSRALVKGFQHSTIAPITLIFPFTHMQHKNNQAEQKCKIYSIRQGVQAHDKHGGPQGKHARKNQGRKGPGT